AFEIGCCLPLVIAEGHLFSCFFQGNNDGLVPCGRLKTRHSVQHMFAGHTSQIRVADLGECILFWRRDSIVTSRGHITVPVLMASTITVERYPALAEIGSDSSFIRTVF